MRIGRKFLLSIYEISSGRLCSRVFLGTKNVSYALKILTNHIFFPNFTMIKHKLDSTCNLKLISNVTIYCFRQFNPCKIMDIKFLHAMELVVCFDG